MPRSATRKLRTKRSSKKGTQKRSGGAWPWSRSDPNRPKKPSIPWMTPLNKNIRNKLNKNLANYRTNLATYKLSKKSPNWSEYYKNKGLNKKNRRREYISTNFNVNPIWSKGVENTTKEAMLKNEMNKEAKLKNAKLKNAMNKEAKFQNAMKKINAGRSRRKCLESCQASCSA